MTTFIRMTPVLWRAVAYIIAMSITFGIGYADITRTDTQQNKELAEHAAELEKDDVREQADAILHAEIKLNQDYMRKEIDASNSKLDAILLELRNKD